MPPREALDLDAVTARWERADRLDAPGPVIESWRDVPAVVAEAKDLRERIAASDRAWKALAAVTRAAVTEEDALSYCLFRTILSGKDAPNCWERDITVGDEARGARTARVSIQWADGRSPHALLAEARAERDDAVERAASLAARHADLLTTARGLAETGDVMLQRMTAAEKERDEALRGVIPRGYVALTSIDAAAAIVDAELVRHLRAIIEGRTTPPTDAEIAAHDAAGGWWVRLPLRGGGTTCSCDACRAHQQPPGELPNANVCGLAAVDRETPGARWWAHDAERRPCPWPVATEAPDAHR